MRTHIRNRIATILTTAALILVPAGIAGDASHKKGSSLAELNDKAKRLAVKTTGLTQDYAAALARMTKAETDEAMLAVGEEITELEQALRISQDDMRKTMTAIRKASKSQTKAAAKSAATTAKQFTADMERKGDRVAAKLNKMRRQTVTGTAVATDEALTQSEKKLTAFQDRLAEMKAAGSDATTELRQGVEEAWDELAQATSDAQKAFRQREATN